MKHGRLVSHELIYEGSLLGTRGCMMYSPGSASRGDAWSINHINPAEQVDKILIKSVGEVS